jgi:hypothetical protein
VIQRLPLRIISCISDSGMITLPSFFTMLSFPSLPFVIIRERAIVEVVFLSSNPKISPFMDGH